MRNQKKKNPQHLLSSSPRAVRNQKKEEGEEEDREGGLCGVTVNGIESTTASSHSPVAPKHTALFANAQKKKKLKKKNNARSRLTRRSRASVFI